jgi:tetraprenyl-beta-curcumene synthase
MGPAPREPDRREPGSAPRAPATAAREAGQAAPARGPGPSQAAPARGAEPGQAAQALAFARGALSYWTSVFPRVCVQIARWRRRADAIPDPVLRHFALEALSKRSDIEGAAAFAAFAPWRHRGAATRAASAYQCAYSLLDVLGEQPSAEPVRDGRRLHEGLVYAVSIPPAPDGDSIERQDWYEHHPQRDDGGYLDSLLDECRGALAALPSYATVAPWAREGAERTVAFQSLNLSEAQGDHEGLERWATEATPNGTDLRWWETAAAAGSSLAVLALIAAAANARLPAEEAQALAAAYFPWIGCLHSLLDNLIDKHEDEAAGHRSLLAYYGPSRTARRLGTLAERARDAADALPHPQRHRVMLTAMIVNYLSTHEARVPELCAAREAVIARAGPLVRPAMWVFAIRRLGS